MTTAVTAPNRERRLNDACARVRRGTRDGVMSNFRFGLMVAVAFVLTFIGVWLGKSNTPVMAARTAAPEVVVVAPAPVAKPMEPVPRKEPIQAKVIPVEPPAVTAAAPVIAPTVEIPRGDGDRGRDRMRLTALEAANAYAQAPCEAATKAAFVVATATYAKAMIGTGGEATQFATPLDTRLREAIRAALAIGGVRQDDFPAETRTFIATLTPPLSSAAPRCANLAAR